MGCADCEYADKWAVWRRAENSGAASAHEVDTIEMS